MHLTPNSQGFTLGWYVGAPLALDLCVQCVEFRFTEHVFALAIKRQKFPGLYPGLVCGRAVGAGCMRPMC
jgi:hypothetical protein